MWFDVIKGVGKNAKKRHNKRLIGRFLDFIPVGEEFTIHDIIQFWESPGQQKYRTEHIPNLTSLARLIRQNKTIELLSKGGTTNLTRFSAKYIRTR